jgi:hypothetical protein
MTSLFRIKKQTLGLIFLYLGLIIFLFSTDPNKLSIGWLILPLVWLFLCFFMTTLILIKRVPTKIRNLSKSKQYTISFLVASLPTLMILLKSINQLTAKDFILFLIFYFLISFYVSKLRFKKQI